MLLDEGSSCKNNAFLNIMLLRAGMFYFTKKSATMGGSFLAKNLN
jgi:hypothetical protein